jgi:hypothetical protein
VEGSRRCASSGRPLVTLRANAGVLVAAACCVWVFCGVLFIADEAAKQRHALIQSHITHARYARKPHRAPRALRARMKPTSIAFSRSEHRMWCATTSHLLTCVLQAPTLVPMTVIARATNDLNASFPALTRMKSL